MVLKKLTTPEMINLTGPWVQKGHPTRKMIQSVTGLDFNLKHAEAAHHTLMQRQPVADSTIAELITEAAAIDLVFGDLSRGFQWTVDGFGYFEIEATKRARLQQLLVLVLPDGLSINLRNYREKAGAAMLLESRLSPEARVQLEALPVPGGTLLDRVEAFIAAGKRLGALEDRRSALEQASRGVTASDAAQARNQWIRAVHALIENLELAAPDGATTTAILAPLRDAEEVAERREVRRADGKRIPTPEMNALPALPARAEPPALPPYPGASGANGIHAANGVDQKTVVP